MVGNKRIRQNHCHSFLGAYSRVSPCKASPLSGNNKKSSKLTREKVVIEDEIDAQQIQVEESQMFLEEDEMLNSTPSVGRKATNVSSADEKNEVSLCCQIFLV